jgi:hypothetical protein
MVVLPTQDLVAPNRYVPAAALIPIARRRITTGDAAGPG